LVKLKLARGDLPIQVQTVVEHHLLLLREVVQAVLFAVDADSLGFFGIAHSVSPSDATVTGRWLALMQSRAAAA
jgi:hypothetical protein